MSRLTRQEAGGDLRQQAHPSGRPSTAADSRLVAAISEAACAGASICRRAYGDATQCGTRKRHLSDVRSIDE